MTRWLRNAAVNKNLIILLAVLVIGAAIFWGVKCRSAATEKEQAKEGIMGGQISKIYCPECNKEFEVKKADAEKLKRDEATHKVECPQCHKLVARFGEAPKTDGVVMP
jgi:endogenous inhibitor of DNA gyrase (YacG/DUF329 family)